MDKVKKYIRRKLIKSKSPLSSNPSSLPPLREKARYLECPGEKASKLPSPILPSTSAKYKSNGMYLLFTNAFMTSVNAFYFLLKTNSHQQVFLFSFSRKRCY